MGILESAVASTRAHKAARTWKREDSVWLDKVGIYLDDTRSSVFAMISTGLT